MLTIQSNLKIQDLETLSKTLVKPDIINFGLNKVGGGYTDKIADKVIAKLSKLDKDKIIVIINDITLQMADKLLDAGYKNIYLAFSSFNKDGTVSKDKTVYNIMKAVIENNIKEKLNAISLEEIFNMKIDGIIANPPYGAIGANIAYTIREKVDYECFVNLLPVNDYKRNKTKDLFNYSDPMEIILDGFKSTGADVTTSVTLIHKNKINNLSLDDFETNQYNDKSLLKYFKENIKRENIFFADYDSTGSRLELWNPDTVFINSTRTTSDKHFARTKESPEYKWNVLNKYSDLKSKGYDALENKQGRHKTSFVGVFLKDKTIKSNIAAFIYSKDGYRFMRKVLTAMAKDSWAAYHYWMPKVDWTRPWTVEEILKDYGYTEDEIKTVMADLDNFKGMDD